MKRIFILVVAMCVSVCVASAKCSNCGSHHHTNCPHHSSHSSSGESHPVYLVKTENHTDEVKFPNCSKHYAITETTTSIYSDGTRRSFSNSTIYNSDGTVLVADCKSIKHTIFEDKHYFIIRKNDGFKILDETGEVITKRNYSGMEELEPNHILVKRDKKYGIINLSEEIIVPIKYQKFEVVNKKILIAKLNGYYGIIDTDNKILIEPDCDSVKTLYDTIVLKRYHKYGLANLSGELIYDIKYDKIKKLGEYILIKKDNKYGVLDYKGNTIGEIKYKEIKLERNKLKGIINKNREPEILQ